MEANELFQELNAVTKRMDDVKIFHHALPFNHTEMQLMKEIVRANEEGKRIISSRLAKILGITRSAVSQIVNKLQRKGIVQRVPDEKDKKIAYIELSKSARGLYDEMRERINHMFEKFIHMIGEEKINQFLKSANEFIDAFNSMQSDFPAVSLNGAGVELA